MGYTMSTMKAYLDIVRAILERGEKKSNRTGVDTIAIAGAMFEHDMSKGFPMLTTKKVPFKLVASELEFFIKGITDKKWLQDRNNHIWDEWCTPLKVPYATDEETKKKMFEERDLGTIYGWEWRHFGASYKTYDTDYTGQGVDQLKKVVDTLKKDPNNRRMLVLAWNPLDVDKALPPYCHYGFQVTVINGKLNLLWNQRSVDTMLGLPFNITSYALLLHLLAKETGLQEGKLVGFLADTHIYVNHLDGAREQLARDPNTYPLPRIETPNFTSIFDWKYEDSQVVGYQSYPRISFEIAV
ncbi:MAG: Thymidylate synthase [Candidatus Magasanikbacteria bacterium GW2011_GWC2_45_8]|uniref:Thymidylate synthase n=1 Tax=Candidatus Magasanikbacteria bacterium GW2011_GWC2_45_8 TaxID=1619050 RepID=A0A0G1MZI1_9BACT|nr:MAG: Thymidylate synthase [Candidatus Magasanikbacteria bacterium GW2011_GWC2_45_8]